MPKPTHRALIIQDHSCKSCGNRWTHSYAVLTDERFSFWGGTPIAFEAELPLISINHRLSEPQNGCFRCALSSIPTPPAPIPRTAKPITVMQEKEPDDLINL